MENQSRPHRELRRSWGQTLLAIGARSAAYVVGVLARPIALLIGSIASLDVLGRDLMAHRLSPGGAKVLAMVCWNDALRRENRSASSRVDWNDSLVIRTAANDERSWCCETKATNAATDLIPDGVSLRLRAFA